MSLKPAVFLDRDGTVIEERGYLADPAQAVLIPGAVEALRSLQEHFHLFIVTNQAGVAEGAITLEHVHAVNHDLAERLRNQGVDIRETYVCPHGKHDACTCRKPSPYFARQAAADHSLDLARSYAVGDHPSDVAFAENFGGTGVYVLTGHGEKHRSELKSDACITGTIVQAVEWITISTIRKNIRSDK